MGASPSALAPLLPVVLLIAVGWAAGRRGWIASTSVKDLSNLVFLLLGPALLFRTMAAQGTALRFGAVAVYFAVALVLYFALLLVMGRSVRAAVLALAGTFSNLVMVGTAIIGLSFGEAGLVTHFALVALHAVVLLTVATLVLEGLATREQGREGGERAALSRWVSVAGAVRSAVIHPVPLPILCGLAWAYTGWRLPEAVDRALLMLGQAFAPLALVLVGVTLAGNRVGAQWRVAVGLVAAKNLLHPALMAGAGWLAGLRGLPLAVLVAAAAMPAGANAFLFSQRYGVAEDEVTATVALSTVVAMVTIPVALWAGRWLGGL